MKNVSLLLLALIIFLAPLPARAAMFYQGPKKKSSTRTSYAVIKAQKAMLEGDYAKVVRIGDESGVRGGKVDDELLCMAGRALLKLNRYDEARNRFSRVLNDSESDAFLDEAYTGLGDSYYLEGDYKNAAADYESVTRYVPDSEYRHIVYYRLSRCYDELGDTGTAKKYYDTLIKMYPDSLEARLFTGEKSDLPIYSVQAGSFTKWSNAKKLSDELKKNGFDATINTAIVGDSRFYRVRVGEYTDRRDAEDTGRALRNKGYSVKIYP